MAPSISTEIDIAAPPSAVWTTLTDFDHYPEWNPFMVKASGSKNVGGKLTIALKPADNSSSMTFSPTIQTFAPNEHLSWEGRLLGIPGLFTGQHHFILYPTDTGTRFEQSEQFSGVLALVLHWIGSNMYETTKQGFALMNNALKERVEKSSSGDPALK
ncbi:MAG: hypothetical protein Q9167_002049 [Letrouitia subvulpina]